MKLYSATLTLCDVRTAFAEARSEYGCDIWIDDARAFRSRQPGKPSGVQFYAESMTGKRASAHGPIARGPYATEDRPRAASWSDYGYVIAFLYRRDPDAIIGQYAGRADFIRRVQSDARCRRGQESVKFLDLVTEVPSHGQ